MHTKELFCIEYTHKKRYSLINLFIYLNGFAPLIKIMAQTTDTKNILYIKPFCEHAIVIDII